VFFCILCGGGKETKCRSTEKFGEVSDGRVGQTVLEGDDMVLGIWDMI
jgi:hypothetical protein